MNSSASPSSPRVPSADCSASRPRTRLAVSARIAATLAIWLAAGPCVAVAQPVFSQQPSGIAQAEPLWLPGPSSPGAVASVPAAAPPLPLLPPPTFPYEAPRLLDDEWDPLSAPSFTLILYYGLTLDSPTRATVDEGIAFDETLTAEDSYGGRLYFDYHLGAYLSFGVAAGLTSWTTTEEKEFGWGRSTLFSASGTLTLWLAPSEHIRQYLRVIGGLSLDSPPTEWLNSGSFGLAAGWHAGGVYGLYLGSDRAGLVLEAGAILHRTRAHIRDAGANRGFLKRQLAEFPFALGLQINL